MSAAAPVVPDPGAASAPVPVPDAAAPPASVLQDSLQASLQLSFPHLYTTSITDADHACAAAADGSQWAPSSTTKATAAAIVGRLQETQTHAVELSTYLSARIARGRTEQGDQDASLSARGIIPRVDIPTSQSKVRLDPDVLSRNNLVDMRCIMSNDTRRVLQRCLPLVDTPPVPAPGSAPAPPDTPFSVQRRDSTGVDVTGVHAQRNVALVDEVRGKVREERERRQLAKEARGAPIDALDSEQIAANRALLRRMRRKLDFIRAPLHDPTIGSTVPVVPRPARIEFRDFQVGRMYEMALALMNAGPHSTRFRVEGPGTPEFRIDLQDEGASGAVAPGMCMRARVQFTPEDLRDYHDELLVYAAHGRGPGTAVRVPLVALRLPPQLTLPGRVAIPPCALFSQRVLNVAFTNKGGPGRFTIMSAREDACASTADAVQAGPITLSPAAFELDTGMTISLSVTFAPKGEDRGAIVETFTIRCQETCSERTLTIAGDSAEVDIVLDSISGAKCVGDDPIRAIVFRPITVQGIARKAFSLRNVSSIGAAFVWQFGDGGAGPFSIVPSKGDFLPHSAVQFVVEFRPGCIDSWQQTAVLALRRVVEGSVARHRKLQPAPVDHWSVPVEVAPDAIVDLSPYLDLRLCGNSTGCDLICTPRVLRLPDPVVVGAEFSSTISIRNAGDSQTAFCWRSSLDNVTVVPRQGEIAPGAVQSVVVAGRATRLDQLVAHLDCDVALGAPVHVRLETDVIGPMVSIDESALEFGLVNFGVAAVRHTRLLTLRNVLTVPVAFAVTELGFPGPPFPDRRGCRQCNRTGHAPGSQLSFAPSSGVIPAGATLQVGVSFSPIRCGRYRATVAVEVPDGGTGAYVEARAEVQAPDIVLRQNVIDLGDVYVRVPSQFQVAVVNRTNLSAVLQWDGSSSSGNAMVGQCRISPSQASLGGLTEVVSKVSLTCVQPGDLDMILAVDIGGIAVPLGVRVRARVHDLRVSAHLRDVADGVAGRDDLIRESIRISARQDARAQESKTIDRHKELRDELARALPYTESAPVADFGVVDIYSEHQIRLCLRNHSAVPSRFRLSMASGDDLDPGLDRTVDELRRLNHPDYWIECISGDRNAPATARGFDRLLANDYEKFSFHSDAGRGFIQQRQRAEDIKRLLTGRAAAFVAYPRSGVLPPWAMVEIGLFSFNSLCGQFNDELICAVDGLPSPIRIPTQVCITGSPLSILPTTVGLRPGPLVQYQPVPVGSGRHDKLVTICNSGSFDIRLQWDVYDESVVDPNAVVRVDISPPDPCGNLSCTVVPYDPRPIDLATSPFPFRVEPVDQVVPAQSSSVITLRLAAPADPTTAPIRGWIQSRMLMRSASLATLQAQSGLFAPGSGAVADGEWLPAPDVLQRNALRLRLSAEAIVPRLRVGKHSHPPLKFVVEAGAASRSVIKWLPLMNDLSTPLLFTLSTSAPSTFRIAKVDVVHEPTDRGSQMLASPGDNISVGVEFRTPTRWPPMPLVQDVPADLVITFANGSAQHVPMLAQLRRPCVALDRAAHEFPQVHIDSCSNATRFTITNVSTCRRIVWRVVHVRRTLPRRDLKATDPVLLEALENAEFDVDAEADDDPRVFEFAAVQGEFEGARDDLVVVFNPRRPRRYLCRYRLEIAHGPPVDFQLCGSGSTQEEHDQESVAVKRSR
ncbi:unnamed protein product (mitochondrion) [Plasmodiophora brassicae]|uniref:MSP domain-containing protein n=1 Tax=Plasmodiophora brassicae TaxID=37360 RepID=A0A0G4IWG5_PLABS|nr:hypothetical protein PBRA_007353 [Plasmodiophora brassicae]SPQ98044.1 unnamed protein product [Plasmodiophora brassicae]